MIAIAPTPPVPVQAFHQVAPTPPMGWNSWDCFGTAVTEAQTKANADYMAEHLARFGYQYIVVDIQWYEPASSGYEYRPNARLSLDGFGRLMPAVPKFPSSDGGMGFKPLADWVHHRGLKFGIHLMRGVPRQAVMENLPVLGTALHCADIADRSSICAWNPDMFGVDVSKPGGQVYYNSVFDLLASWGVDFVKVDDLSRPYVAHEPEIEAIRRAIDQCGRPMVLSMSPGETPLNNALHAAAHANMWRISDDFWDNWHALLEQFDRCANWAPFTGPGHWPDADMLPVGQIHAAKHGWTKFTHDEQITLLSLWCMARSPLMIGANLPADDPFTLSLLTNDEVLEVNQHSSGGRQLWQKDGAIAWIADAPQPGEKYLALFNTLDSPAGDSPGMAISVNFSDVGLASRCHVRNLWQHRDLGSFDKAFSAVVAWHGAVLVRIKRK